MAPASDADVFWDLDEIQWVRANLTIEHQSGFEFYSMVHVPWAVPPDYKPKTASLLEAAIGLDVLRNYSWCMSATEFKIPPPPTDTLPCYLLGLETDARLLLTLPMPERGTAGVIHLNVSARTAQKSWTNLPFILCSGSDLTTFHTDDELYIVDEKLAYTEKVSVGGEELPVKGFPCNVAIGSVVLTARCARVLAETDDRCLGRDVLSHFMLQHSVGTDLLQVYEAKQQ
eukprot:NODE_5824_length_905_cov_64.649616_g5598_i0.p1 GENE.NODE_5824_length_905_cov_64.649616_g5598_i0~~NODE_5824_length_905_cov_64.649616_g5598_i0.p1  ORF type:complete len:229 (+),score=16.68 NODE_5824_length_905_cov_64.649616_g5598_i0:174-860(+)